jgi:hypothetical protein
MTTINQLKTTDHPVIAKLIDINDGKTSSVDYSTTVFETLDGYKRTMTNIDGNIVGSQLKNFVNTPLVAERGNQNKTYFSKSDKGVGFGYIFIDYIKKNPLLVLTVDKDGSDYSYSSCVFDTKDNVWKDGSSATSSIEDIKSLTEFVITNLTTDVNSFSN